KRGPQADLGHKNLTPETARHGAGPRTGSLAVAALDTSGSQHLEITSASPWLPTVVRCTPISMSQSRLDAAASSRARNILLPGSFLSFSPMSPLDTGGRSFSRFFALRNPGSPGCSRARSRQLARNQA